MHDLMNKGDSPYSFFVGIAMLVESLKMYNKYAPVCNCSKLDKRDPG